VTTLIDLGAFGGLRMGAETLLPVMFTKASAKSLDRKAAKLFRIGSVVCGATEMMEMQACCM
jgi:hypothetical protein